MTVRRVSRWLALGLSLPLLLLLGSMTSPDSHAGYVVRQAWFQAEMLWGRVPLEQARHSDRFDEEQLARFDLLPEIQAFGASLGLAATANYTTINPTWDRTIYNLSASDPLAFRPVRWRFPIVGSVPYLGYFRPEDAQRKQRLLAAQGYDVYVRTAGAYSTLGWFEDPLLPHMLTWPEGTLANTIFHELAHATLWIPGSVRFNESYANFVGNEAELRFLVARHGEDSEEVQRLLDRRRDRDAYLQLLHEVYVTLDHLYRDPDLDPGTKLREKDLILAALPTRLAEQGLSNPEPWLRAARRGPWNNARLHQFRTYNDSHVYFAALLHQEGGDLAAFIERLGEVTHGAADPYAALKDHVGDNWLAEVP